MPCIDHASNKWKTRIDHASSTRQTAEPEFDAWSTQLEVDAEGVKNDEDGYKTDVSLDFHE